MELGDAHALVGEVGHDFEGSAHGLDVAAEGAEVHVGAALELRDGRLLDIQLLRDRFLRPRAGLSDLAERGFLGDEFSGAAFR